MHSLYERGKNKAARLLTNLPLIVDMKMSRIRGQSSWPVNVSGTKIDLGFRTLLDYQFAKQESKVGLETEILEKWLAIQSNIVYDIGGYNGLYGILYAKKYPQSRVTIFEPDSINYEQIRENINLNSLKNCFAEKVAISDKEGVLQFSQGGRSKEKIVEAGGVSVPTFPLSHYPKADLLKIDVEGAEGKVLRGLTYPTTVILELHSPKYLSQYGETAESIWNRISELNLKFTLLSDRGSEQHYLLQQKN